MPDDTPHDAAAAEGLERHVCPWCEQLIEPGTELRVQNRPNGRGYGTEELICATCEPLRRALQGEAGA